MIVGQGGDTDPAGMLDHLPHRLGAVGQPGAVHPQVDNPPPVGIVGRKRLFGQIHKAGSFLIW